MQHHAATSQGSTEVCALVEDCSVVESSESQTLFRCTQPRRDLCLPLRLRPDDAPAASIRRSGGDEPDSAWNWNHTHWTSHDMIQFALKGRSCDAVSGSPQCDHTRTYLGKVSTSSDIPSSRQ